MFGFLTKITTEPHAMILNVFKGGQSSTQKWIMDRSRIQRYGCMDVAYNTKKQDIYYTLATKNSVKDSKQHTALNVKTYLLKI